MSDGVRHSFILVILCFLVSTFGSRLGARSWSICTSRLFDEKAATLRLRGGAASTEDGVDSVECKDGVCSIDGNRDAKSALDKVMEVENESKNEGITTLEGLGYSRQDAGKALEQSAGSVEVAAELLEAQEDEKEEEAKLIKELSDTGGWSIEASASALRETGKNVKAAAALLEEEEASIISQFEAATADMLENGWDEVVARQALLAQYTIDQRRANGQSTNTSREVLDSIRPTLRKAADSNEGQRPQVGAKKTAGGGGGEQQPQNKPKPAKKEDCVFDVTSANFQSVVLESPVPVLVDVYADWCGPCKQLGPILEEAAMNSGGMFRLAKVNSDAERGISEALNVQGLPTVFSVNAGKFTDRFVGMLPQEQLQQYLVRCVTGYGEKVQADEISDEDLDEATRKMSSLAGLASISFRKREKLISLVDEACNLDGATEEGSNSVSGGMKVSLLYINNAAKDVRNPKVTTINTASKAFTEKVQPNQAARRVLEIAGFRPQSKDSNGTTVTTLTLLHANSAILTMVSQRVVDSITSKKFAALKRSSVKLGENPSFRSPKAAAAGGAGGAGGADGGDVKEKTQIETGVPLSFLGLNSKLKQRYAEDTTLGEALSALLGSPEAKEQGESGTWSRLEIRFPPPRVVLNPDSTHLSRPLVEWAESGGVVVGLVQAEVESDPRDTISNALRRKKRKVARSKKRGATSLRDYDEKDKRHNESFGGAETVTLLGEESDSDAEVDMGEE